MKYKVHKKHINQFISYISQYNKYFYKDKNDKMILSWFKNYDVLIIHTFNNVNIQYCHIFNIKNNSCFVCNNKFGHNYNCTNIIDFNYILRKNKLKNILNENN